MEYVYSTVYCLMLFKGCRDFKPIILDYKFEEIANFCTKTVLWIKYDHNYAKISCFLLCKVIT